MSKIFKSVNSKYASATGTVTGDITRYHQCGVTVPKNRGESGRKFGLRFTVQEILDFIGEKEYTATFFTKFYNMEKASTEINLLCNFSLTNIDDIKNSFSSSNYTIIIKQENLEKYISTDITGLLKETLSLAIANDETYFSLWGGTNYISDTSEAEARMYGTATDFYPYIEISLEDIPITSITLSSSSLTLTEGETATLTATISPSNATNQVLSWSSTNSSVAEVDDEGKVTANSAGSATITCAATDGSGKSASCNVTVKSSTIQIESIEIHRFLPYPFYPEQTGSLKLITTPEDANISSIEWSSNDLTIVTVDENGLVTAKSPGETIITCKVKDKLNNSFEATTSIRVISRLVTEIFLSPESIDLEIGQEETFTAAVFPAMAENREVEWIFDSSKIEKISVESVSIGSEITIKALSSGTTTLTCKTLDGSNIEKNAQITILAEEIIPVSEINISPEEIILSKGESFNLKVEVLPLNATNLNLLWKINSNYLEIIEENGVFKVTAIEAEDYEETYLMLSAKAESDTTISSNFCSITILPKKKKITSIDLDSSQKILKVGEYFFLTATISPSDATENTNWIIQNDLGAVYYQINNPLSLYIIGLSPGQAIFQIKSETGSVVAECVVTVVEQGLAYIQINGIFTPAKAYIYDSKNYPNEPWRECTAAYVYNKGWKQTK